MISFEEAMTNASNPDDFDLRVKGITGTSDRWDDEAKGEKHESQESPSGFSKF